ncbi:MAG TPA: uroporphyrinogen-III C-methyltransferase [Chthonomonadaceae bacterium]|nr:uroporphyrinogen-III C-methyltransferase [Chthonomonadaceae bacterium]
MSIGTVYLIGAGPGDPGLITLHGLERLRTADVVVYDRLAHPALLEHVRPDAERVYVGKASAAHAMKQADINALLVERAKQGKTVARLKGGDPFVFGRGGEEGEACRAAGVPFEIVPGVTSAIAAPAYAGIPITHRDMASSFAVITGHERDDAKESGRREPGAAEGRRDWAGIAKGADTLVFLMGVEALPEIVARLQEHGRSPETPVALVQWGTWPRQRVVTGTLATIAAEVERAQLTPPAVCVVGEVVRLREALRWFDDPQARPLFGKRALVTRAREQASALSDLLRAAGAEPVEFPVIKIARRDDYGDLDVALARLPRYAWLVFTSANAVPIVAERLEALGLDARAFGGVRIAAIGPATAEALSNLLHLRADFVPSEAVAEAILAEWPDEDLHGKRILLPRAAEAREVLPEQLRARGAAVEVLPIYETQLDASAAESVRDQLKNGEIDVITFTSSSTVRNFAQAIAGEDRERLLHLAGRTLVAAIGPVTAETARENGLEPQIVAETHTIPGLVAALEGYFHARIDSPPAPPAPQ